MEKIKRKTIRIRTGISSVLSSSLFSLVIFTKQEILLVTSFIDAIILMLLPVIYSPTIVFIVFVTVSTKTTINDKSRTLKKVKHLTESSINVSTKKKEKQRKNRTIKTTPCCLYVELGWSIMRKSYTWLIYTCL